MSKKWKINLTNWFLKKYTAKHGRLENKENFDAALSFDNIVIYSTTALGDFLVCN